MAEPVPVDVVVDGGASGTRVGLVVGGELVHSARGGTCNPRVVAAGRGWRTLVGLLNEVWAVRPAGVEVPRSIHLALGAISTAAEAAGTAAVLAGLRESCPPLRAETGWAMSDVVPLTCYPDDTVAIICGTGSCFAGYRADAPGVRWARASGLEYVLADEGSGWDLGARALRAVVRAADGRGPATALSASAPVALGLEPDCAPERIHELVYGADQQKALVALAGRAVLREAAEGDAVAGGLVAYAADELLLGAEACAERVGLPSGSAARYTGSLLLGDEPALREALLPRLRASRFAFRPVPMDADPLQGVRELAARLLAGTVALDGVELAARI